ncbi:MAG: hypothetical protein K9J37_16810 [Saprospiraceae bacterium]|nr:hypothetical protein [Saprospiraceae bacterium]MCF8251577.1 hypothetical protein [Saprospiraceae bacterium]MCF8282822.1 hypothetical protein [Bacteroidales bacterium]MCF8313472.1 hypothetical protein [Saprospiraceae bacterium]MCF8442213.1 hypothetical protein [Saprospiraceae bacterium]
MQDIAPYHRWLDDYDPTSDKKSPFYRRTYDELRYSQRIYDHFIHPHWDEFGSLTLYLKILFADYEEGFAIFEMIGEWNDCLYNDIMFLKREVADELMRHGIHKFVIIAENVLNFHASDDCYYEEWYEDVKDEDGWICLVNLFPHVQEEMDDARLGYYMNFGRRLNEVNWRVLTPKGLFEKVEDLMMVKRRLH